MISFEGMFFRGMTPRNDEQKILEGYIFQDMFLRVTTPRRMMTQKIGAKKKQCFLGRFYWKNLECHDCP